MKNDWYIKAGKDFLAFSILAIGSIHIIFNDFPSGLLPVSDTVPGRAILVYISGAIMIVSAILLMLRRYAGAYLIGVLLLLLLAFFLVPALIKNPYDPNGWTSTFEILSIFSGALMLAGIFLPNELHAKWKIGTSAGLLMTGRYLFAVALVVFGAQHYMYKSFLINLIPAWVPARSFMEGVVLVAFFAVALSIFLQQLERLAASLLAFMFFIWFWILHVPRVIANTGVEAEWTSMFIVMAMCGISLLIMGTARYRKE